MGIGVNKSLDKLALMAESTEGKAVAATAANYVEPVAEGLSFNLEREEIERNLLSDTAEPTASRVGTSTVTGEASFECRANSTTGHAPVDLDLPLRSLLGGKRSATAKATTVGNTATILKFASPHPFKAGDCILVKMAGKYEIRPVKSITGTTVTLAIALSAIPADRTMAEAITTYFFDSKSSATLTAEHYPGNELKDVIAGLRAVTGSLNDWSTGNVPKMAFTFNGLSMTKSAGSTDNSPPDNSAMPPVVLNSCAWINGTKVEYNDFSLSIENTIADLPSACAKSGKISTRIIRQLVTGTINPYTEDSDVNRFELFDKNKDVSLFAYAYNPATNTGELNQAIAIWIPQARITALPRADLNGIYIDDIQFKAHRSSGKDSLFMSFI